LSSFALLLFSIPTEQVGTRLNHNGNSKPGGLDK